ESQPTPSLWTVMYNLLPQIFIKSFSTGSEMGIGAATKTIIKQFMQKKQLETFIETSKQELEHSKEFLLTEEGQRQASKYPGIHKAIEQEETKLKHQELQKPSVSFIFSTAASTALIYTASTMMGEFAKIGLNIALQILVPQKQ
ncbi:MAG TPA: hypothetical protein VLB80_00095, partial [Candidatus Babeliales bacterium]|nr:hypothetical protein [Candidatus Babeliales bacterium]